MNILTKKCLQCGQTIIKPYNESVKNWETRHKFCSKSCLAKSKNHLTKYQFSKERHYVPPTAFKKGHRPSPKSEFKKGLIPWNKNRSWTEQERLKISQSLPKRFGSKSPRWKGGITPINEQIRHCSKMKQWILQIFQRDNYVCVLCGRRSKTGDKVVLNADHFPKPFYQIRTQWNILSLEQALACEELWDIKNGRTLCVECHAKTKGRNQHTTA